MKNVVNILVIILIIALSIFSISYTNEYLYEDTNIQKDSDKKEIVVITSKVTTTKKKEIQKDIYPIENITDEDVFKIFNEKQAMVIGDSMAEGLPAYEVLDNKNVVYTRGRRIDNMEEDIGRIIENSPKYLFLSYGANDLEMWVGDVTSFIKYYKNKIIYLREILKEALAQAKKARFEILDVIEKQIAKPREDVSKYAPKTEVFMINPDKIKDVIGRGGEMITKIILECSNVNTVNDINAVKVDLEDDGRVIIYHTDRDVINRTADRIKDIAREVEIGKTYSCRVVSIQDFGIFVELWPGCEGLVHVSHLDSKRVEKPSDVVSVGDEIIVKSAFRL